MQNTELFEFEIINKEASIVKFNGNKKDINIIIPDTYDGKPVTEIKQDAFSDNLKIQTIILPKTLKRIQKRAFCGCKYLKEIEIPNSVIHIDEDVFFYCISLEKITLSNNLKSIPYRTFSHCFKLQDFILPDSIETIVEHAFCNCKNLTEIKLPKNLKSLHVTSFHGCENLSKILCENTNLKIPKKAFVDCNISNELSFSILKQLELTETQIINLLTNLIANWDNYDKKEQKEYITFFKRREKIKEFVFTQKNSALVHFLINQGVTIKIDKLLSYIEDSIKNNNNAVTAILLDYKNKNFTQDIIQEYNERKELVEIGLVLPTLKQFKEKWKCTKTPNGLIVTGYKGNETEQVTIPTELYDGTKIVEIKSTTTGNFKNIKKLIIEAEIKIIPEKTFSNCTQLEEITIPPQVEILPNYCFFNCYNLKELHVSKTTKIAPQALKGCKEVEVITND